MFTDEEVSKIMMRSFEHFFQVQSITKNNPHVNINDDHDRLIDTCKVRPQHFFTILKTKIKARRSFLASNSIHSLYLL